MTARRADESKLRKMEKCLRRHFSRRFDGSEARRRRPRKLVFSLGQRRAAMKRRLNAQE